MPMPLADRTLVAERLACLRGGRLVFTDLSFALPAGGALLLTGPNGAGKSSLLRLAAGLLSPFDGWIGWRAADGTGVSLTDAGGEHRGATAYIGFADAVKPTLTVSEDLHFWASVDGVPRPKRADRVADALRRLDIAMLGDMPGRFLSSGQRRRLSLARLLLQPKALWLLDEPSVGLDRSAIGLLESLIADHRAAGGRVLVATHQPIDLPDATALDLGPFAVPIEEAEDWDVPDLAVGEG